MAEYRYPLDNTGKAARERLALLETVTDPWTTRCIEKIGIEGGWRCLELAGGGGSVTEWLCRRVGASGKVVATDLQPHFLEAIGAPNLEVLRHDLIRDPLPERSFDLVHARAVLTFLPDPELALRKMVSALKPGGWLLIEEPDYVSATPDPSMNAVAAVFSQKAWDAMLKQIRSEGYNTEFGRRLYRDVVTTGLQDVQAEGFVEMSLGGKPWARFWRVTFEQLQERIQESGFLTSQECERYRALLESPDYRWLNVLFMSVWGRRSPTA